MVTKKAEDLSPLEIAVLALVKLGLTTPYDLISQAGVSVGASSPALKRLEQDGFLSQTPGPRNRTDYALTKRGEARLKASLKTLRDESHLLLRQMRFQSASRIILLLWVYFGADEALACLNRAAEEFRAQARRKEREADDLRDEMSRMARDEVFRSTKDMFEDESSPSKGPVLAVAFRWMKTSADAALLDMEAAVTENMAQMLLELPPSLQMPLDR